MKKWLFVLVFLFLNACSTITASEKIVESTIRDVKTLQERIEIVEKTTPKECKTDVFILNLQSLKGDAENITVSISNLQTVFKTEKEVLEQELTTWKISVYFLVAFLLIFVYNWIRSRKWL